MKDKLGADYETEVKPYLRGVRQRHRHTVPGDDIDNGTLIISVSAD